MGKFDKKQFLQFGLFDISPKESIKTKDQCSTPSFEDKPENKHLDEDDMVIFVVAETDLNGWCIFRDIPYEKCDKLCFYEDKKGNRIACKSFDIYVKTVAKPLQNIKFKNV